MSSVNIVNSYKFALDGEGGGQGGIGDFLLQETGDKILIDDDPIGLETGDNVLIETGDFLIMEQNRMLL